VENSGIRRSSSHRSFDVALDDERANAVAELWPLATHARVFDQHLEWIEDGVNESSGRSRTGILGDVEPDLLAVLFGKAADATPATSWCELYDRAT
jgi:hypothetical protein